MTYSVVKTQLAVKKTMGEQMESMIHRVLVNYELSHVTKGPLKAYKETGSLITGLVSRNICACKHLCLRGGKR